MSCWCPKLPIVASEARKTDYSIIHSKYVWSVWWNIDCFTKDVAYGNNFVKVPSGICNCIDFIRFYNLIQFWTFEAKVLELVNRYSLSFKRICFAANILNRKWSSLKEKIKTSWLEVSHSGVKIKVSMIILKLRRKFFLQAQSFESYILDLGLVLA